MDKFVYPEYDGKSLLNIPSTILSLFGGSPFKKTLLKNFYQNAEGAEKIILFLIDGLGFNLFQKATLEYPFFQNLKKNGFTSSITTVFPSTTAAALNSLYSGLSPFEHGLPEWYVYFPELGCVLESLPFAPVNPGDADKVLNPPKDILFKGKTIFQQLNDIGVSSFSLVPHDLIESLYTQTVLFGSSLVGYEKLEALAQSLIKLIKNKGEMFITVYYPNIDSSEHKFGHLSQEVQRELFNLSNLLQTKFIEEINSEDISKVSLMLTADHGQVTTDLKDVIYLDEIPGILECLKKDKNGKPIPPTSGTRNAFLNIKEEKLDFALRLLDKELEGKAYVWEMRQALELGLFGDINKDKRFLERTGNVLLVALSCYTLGYHYTPDFELKVIGRHGGLSSDEMLIPFACARLSTLKNDF